MMRRILEVQEQQKSKDVADRLWQNATVATVDVAGATSANEWERAGFVGGIITPLLEKS